MSATGMLPPTAPGVISIPAGSGHEGVMRRRTVLLAEDDAIQRCLMESALRAMGCLVAACTDARHASSVFQCGFCIDALVTDFHMPGKTGMDLARELTALNPELPVIIITGSFLSEDILEEIEARGWNYFSKPADLAVLEAILQRL